MTSTPGSALNIQRINLGFLNVWLLQNGKNWLVVDSGKKSTIPVLLSRMASAGCDPNKGNISIAVMTHAHFDHVGGAGAIKKASGAPIAIHEKEAPTLRSGSFCLSDGLNIIGKTKAYIGRRLVPRDYFNFDPVEPDIIVNGDMRLDGYGFKAAVIHTPGHTEGSISILTDSGDLFCGDLFITQYMTGLWRHMPIYGSSVEDIRRSWRLVIDRGAKVIYPAHGEVFPACEVEKWL